MTDITFITSNQTKVAHARYLCKGYDVNILQYKKLFYGVGYNEPRIYDRRELLQRSFDDALRRWEKNVAGSGNRLFFIEDTSVRIDALSDEKNEVPGVDVKYWMQAINFTSLDKLLREHGNNRKVSVSSHVILFLTDSLKEKVGTKDRYKVFTSTSNGNIVEHEQQIETQILYPWLDNKTFNKWFVPDGYSLPISLLKIEDADNGDFRKGAFQQMLRFLKENGQIESSPKPMPDLRLQFDDIFVVCGPTCSGKSTIGKYLVDNYGYYHIEASDFMTLRYHETHGAKSQIDKHKFAAEVLNIDPLFVVDKVLDYLYVREIYDKFVITGFRTVNEVSSFMKRFISAKLKLIYLNADFDTRFKRWVLRKRDTDTYTQERFEKIDLLQKGMGVTDISRMIGTKNLDNNWDGLKYLYTSFDKVIDAEKTKIQHRNEETLCQLDNISLEKAILITLALIYQEDETKYVTTTEISKQINHIFKKSKKNKNNVSRYFNQSYSLYFDVKKEGRKIKYKISPIGYSEAMKLLTKLDS
jgi:adenylate kinase family enzyme/inosine/xanthosine triphosphate pyrophosphatase family protein